MDRRSRRPGQVAGDGRRLCELESWVRLILGASPDGHAHKNGSRYPCFFRLSATDVADEYLDMFRVFSPCMLSIRSAGEYSALGDAAPRGGLSA